MDYRYLYFLGAAFLGALLGIFFRVRTLVIALAVILGLTLAGIGIAAAMGGEGLAMVFGIASIAIPVLGLVLVAAAGVVRAAERPRDNEVSDSWGSPPDLQAPQTPNKSL